MVGEGRVYFWNGGSLWIGRGRGRSDWHDHHAHQLALAFEGEMRFRCAAEGAWTSYVSAIVTSHQPHQFEIALDDDTALDPPDLAAEVQRLV